MKKLKIGVVCYPSIGGSGVVATELGIMMAQKGHEVHFISSSMPFRIQEPHPRIQFHEVTIEGYAVFKYPPYDIALANRIAEVLIEYELDLLHVHYAVPHAISAALAKDMANSTIPVITTLHGTDVTVLGYDTSLRNTVCYGLKKSTVVTAVSESLKKQTEELIQPTCEIQTIYNFIDEQQYIPQKVDETLRSSIGLTAKDSVIIHVSNFRDVKNIPDIIATFEKVYHQHPCKLLLVGDGPEREAMKSLVKEKGLLNEVFFLGKRTDMPQLLALSDVMLHLSKQEAFGLVILEAMACGVPTVGTRVGGIPEVIEDERTGYLVPLYDVNQAADCTLRLLQQSDLRQAFSEAGVRVAKTKFHSSEIVNQYEALYEKVVITNEC